MRRLLIATCLILGQVVVPAVPAQAAACSGTNGVTVVVDFSSLGGGIQTRCASSDPASGWAALQATGFTITPVQRFPGFVCRIDGKPAPGDDPCVNTPPDTAYWSYWHAKRGGSWTYSGEGPSTRDPAPGTVEGWAFGSGGKPGIAPPAALAPPPSPPPPPPPKTSSPSATSPAAAAPPSSEPAPSESSSAPVATTPSAAPKPASFTGFASGVGLVLLLAGVTVYLARRRRPTLPR